MTFQEFADHFADRPEIAEKIKTNIETLNDGAIRLTDEASFSPNMKNILRSAFMFELSPEGSDYWEEIVKTL